MSAWIARVLARWANIANVRAREVAEADLKEQKAIVAQRDSTIALQKAEIEYLAQWRDSELAVLQRKAEIERIAKTAAQELPERD